jgi:hypothetical protein
MLLHIIHGTTILSIMTLGIKGLYGMTLRIIDTQHNITLHCAECRYADCGVLFRLCFSVITPSVVMLNVIILSALAPNLL